MRKKHLIFFVNRYSSYQYCVTATGLRVLARISVFAARRARSRRMIKTSNKAVLGTNFQLTFSIF